MKPRELKALIKILRSTGVVSYEADGLKLLLDPNFISASTSKNIRKSTKANNTQDLQEQVNHLIPQMSDDDWLLATNLPTDDEATQ